MVNNKRMKLETIREKLLESYMDSYYEKISHDGSIQGWIQYNKGKMIGLSQALIYLGVSTETLADIRDKANILFNSKRD